MSQTLHERCLRCGRPDEGERTHCLCGACLLVDVVLQQPCPPERERFLLARALAPLGAPVPPFAELRKVLSRADGQVLQGVSQVFARQVVEVLATHGAAARLRPSPNTRAGSGWVPRVLGGVAVALCLMGVGAVVATRTPLPLLKEMSEASSAPAAEASKPPGLTTQEISRRALPSTVSLRCETSTGSGFFVSEGVVLTNAHVACPMGKVMEVTLADGRRVLGQTLERDETLDLATVRVSGGRAEPLPMGDATLLSPGDKLVFIGSPKGLSFTVHEGKVSHLGREYLGLGYVQFDASVNPGNSGGPLLNERGEVVGVVSLKITDGEGIGLALPIQYAGKRVTLPDAPDAAPRWAALLEKVAREEERELRRYRMAPYAPALTAVGEDEQVGLVVMLMEKFPHGSSRMFHHFQLQLGTDTCEMDVEFTRWMPLEKATEDENKGGDPTRRLQWLKDRGLIEGLHVSAERLPVESCSKLPAEGEAQLLVSKGSPELASRKVDLAKVARARELWKAQNTASQRPTRTESAQTAMASRESLGLLYTPDDWKLAFQRVHGALARLQAERNEYAEKYAQGDASARGMMDDIDRRLKQVRNYLDDLERHASYASVPREWRQ